MSELLMPQHISKIGLYTGQIVLANSIVAFYYEYYISSFILGVLYITTMIHWNKLYRTSVVKTIDIIFATSSIISVTFRDSKRFHPTYATIWYNTVTLFVTMFVLNECLLYYRLSKSPINKEPIYYTSVYIHTFFLHLVANGICIICVIGTSTNECSESTLIQE